MKLLTRADFTGASPRRFHTEPLPWDTDRGVRVRSLSETEAGDYESGLLQKRKGQIEVRGDAV